MPRSDRLGAFLSAWRVEVTRTKRLDQKVLNQVVLRGDDAVAVWRLPSAFWASSNASPPPLRDLVLHHAHFTLDVDRRPSSDPTPKLDQLDLVRRLRLRADASDSESSVYEALWTSLVANIKLDASLARYRKRHFKADDQPTWDALPDSDSDARALGARLA